VPINANNKWETEEDEQLRKLIGSNVSTHLIAAKLKRSYLAIKARIRLLKLYRKRRPDLERSSDLQTARQR